MSVKLTKYAVLNNKGGVGKSTIAVHIAHGLARRGNRVLLIDLDGQNDASLFLGFAAEDFERSLYDLAAPSGLALSDCVIPARENLDLLPSRQVDRINAQLYQKGNAQFFFAQLLGDIERMEYRYVVIDCGPQRSNINDAALFYVDSVIVPIQMEAASVRAIGNVYEYIADLGLNAAKIAMVIPNMLDQRTSEGKDNLEFLKEFFEDSDVLTEAIHRRVKIAQGGKLGKTVYEYDERSAQQFERIVERLVGRNERKG